MKSKLENFEKPKEFNKKTDYHFHIVMIIAGLMLAIYALTHFK